MSLFDAIHAGRTGLRVASAGIAVTGHNVANAATEGYSRRSLERVTADPVLRSGLLLGQGARATGTSRSSDRFLESNLLGARGDEARSEAALETLSGIEALFPTGEDGGISGAYNRYFDALRALGTDPSDAALRAEAAAAAGDLAGEVSATARALRESIDAVQAEFESAMAEINAQIEAVAALNAQIAASSAGGADYADQIVALVGQLAEEVGVEATFAADGTTTLLLGGHAVVSGEHARTLEVEIGADGVPAIKLSVDDASVDVSEEVGGAFGGRIDAAGVADEALDDLDEFAETFGEEANTRHAAGYDQDGNPGGELFSWTAGGAAESFAFSGDIALDPSLLALAGAPTATAGDGDNLESLLDMEDTELFDEGTGGEFLSGIFARVGRAVSQAEQDEEVCGALVSDLGQLRDAVSGVDLDQEAGDLLGWQASYEAAARVVSTANDLLGELMDVVG